MTHSLESFFDKSIKYKKVKKEKLFAFLDLLCGLDIPVYNLNLEMFEDINSKNKVCNLLKSRQE
ncbi:MAG: hypothetical protein L6V95_14765 [Candidatus Melainabacteria bacterium]|nr:MAG: hypothetical protein L6V95_14765 [Candidatus Melainabacteria bacterium]